MPNDRIRAASVDEFTPRSSAAASGVQVLVIPSRDRGAIVVYCQDASSLLAHVTILLRDSERKARFDPMVEVEYEADIEAFTQSDLREASAHHVAARNYLENESRSVFFPLSAR